MKALDFFCGAGGLTRGLLDAGIDVVAGIDIDERLRRTYDHNNYPSAFVHADIEDIDIGQLRQVHGIEDTDQVLYAACCPCQPFSSLNRNKTDDTRRHLLLPFVELIEQHPPDFVLVENVPGLNTAYGRDVYELFTSVLGDCGFTEIFQAQLDAADFEVPQVRRRWIMLASRLGPIQTPQIVAQRATVAGAISLYPALNDGEDCPNVFNHEARTLMPHHRTIVQAVPQNGGSRAEIEDQTILLPCHRERPNVHKDVFGRMRWAGQAPTLTCRCTDVYCGRFIHPDQNRGLSLREAAALQTFRDDYQFFGSFFHIARQIGNAVPVRFAEHIGQAILGSVPVEATQVAAVEQAD